MRRSRTSHRHLLIPGLILAALTIAADQATKAWLKSLLLDPPRQIPVIPDLFTLVAIWNRGVSFGMLSGHDGWGAYALSAFAIVVSIVLLVWLFRAANLLVAVGLGLIIGGAIGNVIDRLTFGAVFDFLLFGFDGHFFPAFNLADSAITIGVILLIGDGLIGRRDRNT